MNWKPIKSSSLGDINRSKEYSQLNFVQKPIEIYVFIDPTCPKCWSLEPYLKKLSIEYGRFFTIRTIINSHLNTAKDQFDEPRNLKEIWNYTAKRTGMNYDKARTEEGPAPFPFITSIAIKAAELQGKSAGRAFLRKVQENFFLKKQNTSNKDILISCAEEAKIDVEEFKNDLFSNSAKKAFQCDLKLKAEMSVDHTPAMVFFNQDTEEEGIKVSGLYPYSIYVLVLSKMLQFEPTPAEKPPLEDFLAFYKVVANKEISVVYDWTLAETNKQMKILKLKQKVIKRPVKYGAFWKYK